MTSPTHPVNQTRAARRAQLLFDRHCAAIRRQSLKIGVRSPTSMPLPNQVHPARP